MNSDKSQLEYVSCSAPDSCFALGVYNARSIDGEVHLFVDHWDGEQWSAESLSMPVNRAIFVDGLSCSSSNWCMAAIDYATPSPGSQSGVPVIYVWDGEEWSTAATPAGMKGVEGRHVFAVSCLSADDCVATGGSAWVAHWDGESWSEEAIPLPTEPSLDWLFFEDLSCTAADACSAVGLAKLEGVQIFHRIYSAHWDGEKWTVEAMPEPPGMLVFGFSNSLSCSTADDCVFVTPLGWSTGSTREWSAG